MTYRVILTDPAFDAIQAQARYIAIEQQAPEAAQRWLVVPGAHAVPFPLDHSYRPS